jgi:hypothetical protein
MGNDQEWAEMQGQWSTLASFWQVQGRRVKWIKRFAGTLLNADGQWFVSSGRYRLVPDSLRLQDVGGDDGWVNTTIEIRPRR